jgi:transcriptional regulator with XRE-family HTH domain
MCTLRETRINKGISQKALAKLAGIDARTLRKIENGDHVSEVSFNAVEKALGVASDKAGDTRQSRQKLVESQTFYLYAGAFYAAVFCIVALFCYADSVYWALSVPILIIASPVTVFLYYLLVSPGRGNTCVEFKTTLSQGFDLSDPLQRAKEWLGREDVMVGNVEFDGDQFRFQAFADYDFHEYRSLINKLRDFGLIVSVRSAA